MATEGERPESAAPGPASGPDRHFTPGDGRWGYVSPPPPDASAVELLAVLGEVRSDLAPLQGTDEIVALRDECDAAVEEISRTGRVTPDLIARLRARLAAAGPAQPFLASGTALARSLDRLEAHLPTARPVGEASMRTMPAGRARPGGYETPAGHTPPGPSTGSDDDEWPDPADG
ncbi:hypothetical protein [Streptomyces hawaiiensis]|uniref:hypothetical protein n=1 Tax=Streptomyces hawaiiensis TaxID=67305 RepID=UPI001586BAF7|nr:hypothetical protein [Streptomyces hawaiiensis]